MTTDRRLHWSESTLVLRDSLRTGRSLEDSATVFTIRLTTTNAVGWGEVAPQSHYGETPDQVVDFLRSWDPNLVPGGYRPESINRDLKERSAPRCVRSGMVSAAYDLLGRSTGVTVSELLGLTTGARPPTSLTISLDHPAAMAAAAAAMDPAIRVLKLKLGGRDGADIDRIAAVRDVTDRPLTVDVNGSWSPDEAADIIPRAARLGVILVEQPLEPRHPGGPELRGSSEVPIFLDEDVFGIDDLAFCSAAAHGINVKLSKCGGLVEAMGLIQEARRSGLLIQLGCEVESSLGLAPAVALSALADHVDLDSGLLLADDPWTGLPFVNGSICPAPGPGFGLVSST